MRLKPSPPLTAFLLCCHAAELLTLASCRPALARETVSATWFHARGCQTASGKRGSAHTIAAPRGYRFGTVLLLTSRCGGSVRHWRGVVEDRGGKIGPGHLDPSEQGARALFGPRWREIGRGAVTGQEGGAVIIKKMIYGCEARGDAHSPYMTRYILLRTRRGELCLHVFHRSDDRVLHDHPWDFWTLILWRGYIEVLPGHTRRVWPGMILRRKAEYRHFVTLVNDKPAITLIWKSPRRREWGFFTGPGVWEQWQAFFKRNGC